MKKETIQRLRALSHEGPKAEKKLEVQATGSVLELSIYGNIEPDSYDWWTGETIESETSARHFKSVLDEHPNVSLIRLNINSMGGYVSEGNAIYALLRRHQAKVEVYIDGFACSMASAVAMAGDTVTMAPNALMMIHNPWTYAWGNAKELRKAADDLDAMAEAFRQTYLLKAGDKLSEDKLVQMLDDETFLNAKQCQEYGLCDVVEGSDLAQAKAEIQELQAQIRELKAQMNTKPNIEPKPVEKPGWFFS